MILGVSTDIRYGICKMLWYHYCIAGACAVVLLSLMMGFVRWIINCCDSRPVYNVTIVHQEPYRLLDEHQQGAHAVKR